MTGIGDDVGGGVDRAWERIEASLGRVLPASLRQLKPPAEVQAIDAMESALAVALPQEFRASLRVHDGTKWPAPHRGQPSPVPLECLYDTSGIVTPTRMWRGNHAAEPAWDDPRVWAHLVDGGMICLYGPVRPIVGSAGAVMVGDMNGDVHWFLDFDPAPGGRPGQVVRVDVECSPANGAVSQRTPGQHVRHGSGTSGPSIPTRGKLESSGSPSTRSRATCSLATATRSR